MNSFKTWMESGLWGDPCSLFAICELFPVDRKIARQVLLKHGLHDDAQGGIRLANLTLALDELGIPWHVRNTKQVRGMTPKELAEKGGLPGKHIVMVHGHVMPMYNGNVTNFCGHGDEPIQVLLSLEPKNKTD